MSEADTLVLTDARIVLADAVVERGWVAVDGGTITEIGEGQAPERGLNLDGDLLIPGLVELHTDHLEPHVQPRPKVDWNITSAVHAYDAQVTAAGITTVFDCIRIGVDRDNDDPGGSRAIRIADALQSEGQKGHLRAEHRTHLRCEICSRDVVKAAHSFLGRHSAGIMSLMDHTPGQRQFRNVEKLRAYYLGKTQMSEAELERFFEERYRLHAEFGVSNRSALVEIARANGATLASHDDTTLEHVEESLANGAAIAEFPTTLEAARASHEAGIAVVMGAPNLVRGGSHSGNVAASELAQEGLLDIFSSDYIPASLIMAASQLADGDNSISLPAAIATITRKPAQAVGLTDRGEIAVGKRADLVQVRPGDAPLVRTVWREGRRVI